MECTGDRIDPVCVEVGGISKFINPKTDEETFLYIVEISVNTASHKYVIKSRSYT